MYDTPTGMAGGLRSEHIPPQQPASGVQGSGLGSPAPNPEHIRTLPTVYAIGKISYDFGTEANRDAFTQAMESALSADERGGSDARVSVLNIKQMVAYLEKNPTEAHSLVWTLNIDSVPCYALAAIDPHALETYALLIGILKNQILKPDHPDHILRVSLPGYVSGKTRRLYSGQQTPLLYCQPYGVYAWAINGIIAQLSSDTNGGQHPVLSSPDLHNFNLLAKLQYQYINTGQTAEERALNFGITLGVQTLATMIARDKRCTSPGLAGITVQKSVVSRINSDCWIVQLSLFDTVNNNVAMTVYRAMVDVSELVPVMVGEFVTWPGQPN